MKKVSEKMIDLKDDIKKQKLDALKLKMKDFFMDKKKVALFLFLIILCVSFFIFFSIDNFMIVDLYPLAMFCSVAYGLIIFSFRKSIFSISFLYYIAIVVFNTGAIFASRMGHPGIEIIHWTYDVGVDNFQKAIFFYILSISVYTLTIIIKETYYQKKTNAKTNHFASIKEKDYKNVFNLGALLTLIAFPVFVYVLVVRSITLIQGDYIDIYYVNIPSPLIVLSKIFYTGPFFMLIGMKNFEKAKKLFYLTVIIMGLSMLQGTRSEAIGNLVALVLVYYFYQIKPNNQERSFYKQVLILGGLAFYLLNLFREYRLLPEITLNSVSNMFVKSLNLKFIYDLIYELGSTLKTLVYSINFFPKHYSFGFGRNYVTGLLSFLPGISRLLPAITKDWSFPSYFPGNYSYSIGGSILAELYFNFGYLGCLGTSIVALFNLYIEEIINDTKKGNLYIKATILSVFPGYLFFIRGYMVDFYRQAIMTIIFIVVTYILYNKVLKKGEYYKKL